LASSVVIDRARDSVTIPQFISHLFYLQGILGYKQINSVFWTLCLEIQLYAIYVLLRLTNSGAVLYGAFIASLIWPIGLHPGWPGIFAGFWYAFLLGAGAYLSWFNASLRPWFLVYATVIAIAAIHRSDYFALVSCATAASLLVVSITGRQTQLLNWRWLQYLGAISYSLYLIHNPVTRRGISRGICADRTNDLHRGALVDHVTHCLHCGSNPALAIGRATQHAFG
jgi:peptidoglycan/LPS O-acetylase OafA/YrhL